MSVVALVRRLQRQDVRLYVENGRLRVNAPNGALSAEQQQELRAHKEAILALLQNTESVQAGDAEPSPLLLAPRDRPLPVSFAQRRLWLALQASGPTAAYNVPVPLRIEGEADVQALRWSLDRLIERHESLRTVFAPGGDGEPVQQVLAATACALEERALAQPQLAAALADAARTLFDLERGPLLRVVLFRIVPPPDVAASQVLPRQHGQIQQVLLLVLHHIVADGWSLEVLLRELSALYAARCAGAAPVLSQPLSAQYADYAYWQRQQLQGATLAKLQAYWRNVLDGAPNALAMPSDHPRPGQPALQGADLRFRLPAALCARIETLGREERATPFMVLLAGFYALLARFSGENDVVVGTPIAQRPLPEFEPLIGFFVDALPLRARIDPARSFRSLLREVRATVLDAFAHQALPFDALVEAVNPPRSPGHAPIFQTMFALHSASTEPLRLGDLALRPIRLPGAFAKFDLSLTLEPAPDGGLEGVFEYALALFAPTSIVAWAAEYRALLDAFIVAPDTPLRMLACADAEVLAQRVKACDGGLPVQWPYACVPEAVAAWALAAPAREAVADASGVLRYDDLIVGADALALQLIAAGVGVGDRVGLCLGRSAGFAVAALAVWRCGAAWLALDPDWPVGRIVQICAEARPRMLLVSANTKTLCAGVSLPTLDIDAPAAVSPEGDTEKQVSGPDLANPKPQFAALHPLQPAYLIYTSGSTGTPKGAVIGHGALRNLVSWLGAELGAQPGARWSQLTQIGFDASVLEFWTCLAHGGCLRIADDQTRRRPAMLRAWLAAEAVELAFAPTPLAEELLAEELEAPDLSQPVSCQAKASLPLTLRVLATGGDRLKRYPSKSARFRLLNLYGPSETAVATVGGTVLPPATVHDAGRPITIGRPIAGVYAYVLDGGLHPLPEGAPGELFLAGDSLGLGYWARPELSAERFLPDPFARVPGARMYRTGDRVRRLSDGRLEYFGRVDAQIKLRGFRIEPGEIEQALSVLPGVSDSVVTVRNAPNGAETLIAYLVPLDQATPPTPAALRAGLVGRLPSYMVPGRFVVLSTLPLAASGKVDRRALPAPDWRVPTQAAAIAMPQTPLEVAIAATWCHTLGLEEIATDEDFFALGGHSLTAARTLARLSVEVGMELPLNLIFEAPSIAALAARIDAMRGSGAATMPPLLAISAQRQTLAPLSHAQRRLWFMAQLTPDDDAYRIPLLLELRGALDREALAAALADVITRHAALRTRLVFSAGEDVPRQTFDAPSPALIRIDIAPEDLHASAQARVALPMAPMRDALFHATLLCVSPARHALVLVLHHLIADGESVRVLAQDLAVAYRARRDGCAPDWVPLTLDYGDYAAWQHHADTEAASAIELSAWKARLVDPPPLLELPIDATRNAADPPRACVPVAESLPPALVKDLQALGLRHRTTLFMTLLAVFQLLLHRLSGQDDLCVGTPVIDRHRAELEPMVGLFLGTLPLRTRIAREQDFAALLEAVRESVLDAFSRRRTPFERIVDALRLPRHPGRHALFQSFFNLIVGGGAQTLNLPGLESTSIAAPAQGAKFDLTLYAIERGDSLDLQLHYDARLFAPARVAEMLRQYCQLLQQITSDSSQRLSAYNLRTEAAEQLLPNPRQPQNADWRGAIQNHIAAQAARDPLREAVRDPHLRLSYAALDAAANRLAHGLSAHGIGAGDVVALRAARRAELAVAMLATLKVGAAFAILDSAWPLERLLDCARAAQPVAWLDVAGLAFAESRLGVTSRPGESRDERHVRYESLSLDASEAALEAALVEFSPRLRLRASFAEFTAACAALPDTLPNVPASGADSRSHIAFTSGSSGAPKAIDGRHGPFTHFLPWLRERFALGPQDRFSALSGLAHDPFQRDLLLGLMVGATVCVPDPEDIAPVALAAWMRAEAVTVANLTPAMLRVLAETGDGGLLPALRCAFVVGEALRSGDAAKLAACAPNCEIISFYGTTETQWALAWQPVVANALPIVALGKGFPDVQLLVLDAQARLTGVGESGEIYLRSPHLAAGYHGGSTEELTPRNHVEPQQARFLRNPFMIDAPAHDRLYRTGDLGRYDADGCVHGLGRSDRQLNLRGYRIEPGEIEAALLQVPTVAQAAVLGLSEGDHARLVACVVPISDVIADLDWLRVLAAALAKRLPMYMRPQLVPLATLPLNANGKLDRMRLLQLAQSQADAPVVATMRALRTESERQVATVFAEVLSLGEIAADDDFFSLGGNSLRAMRAVSRLRQVFAISIPLRRIFDSPQVFALAAWLDAQPAQTAHKPVESAVAADAWTADSGASILPAPLDAPLPLSFSQQRLWFLHRLEPASAAYNMRLALSLDGALDVAALAAALQALSARHASLRTCYPQRNGIAEQRLLPPETPLPLHLSAVLTDDLQAIDLQTTDLQAIFGAPLPGTVFFSDEGQTCESTITAFADIPFDLEREPPARALLLRLGKERHAFVLAIHHIATDGWSMAILLRELTTFYVAHIQGAPAALPALPCAYADYAHWQRQRARAGADAHSRAFWLATLSDLPPLLALPGDRERPHQQSYRGGQLPIALSPQTLTTLRGFCAQHAVTPFMVLLAAWQILLARHCATEDIAVGVPVANREQPALEPLVGFFVNTVVLRAQPRPALKFVEFLAQVRELSLAAFAHQDCPFETVVEMLRPERSLAHAPLFQTMFNLQNMDGAQIALPGVQVAPLSLAERGARFDLTLVLREGAQQMVGVIEYACDLFDAMTVERFAARYLGLLEAALLAPQTRLAELPILCAADSRTGSEESDSFDLDVMPRYDLPVRQGLLKTTNDAIDLASMPVHLALRVWARRTPQAQALRGAAQPDSQSGVETLSLDYRSLAACVRAQSMALRALGVGVEDRVGLLLVQSPAAVIATLAVLDAGAAFMPFDPDTPPLRLQQMLVDAGLRLLLTAENTAAHAHASLPILSLSALAVLATAHAGAADADADERSDAGFEPRDARHGKNEIHDARHADTSPSRLAYAIYTSGTTGTPKAAMVSCGAWAAVTAALACDLGLKPGTRLLQVASPAFDVAAADLALALSNGATLVLAPPAARRDPEILRALLCAEAISHVQLPVALLAQLPPEGLDTLRCVVAGGEAMPSELPARWRGRALFNAYGPTETTITASHGEQDGAAEAARIDIGRPLSGVRIYVLDQELRPLPPGVWGELYIAGAGVGRGYLGRPGLTAERFLPDMFSVDGGARMYRSADIGRRLLDGRLEIRGRSDDQIKLRGYRIEPGEIEAVLRTHPDVREAAVLLREDRPGQRRLAAYLVLRPGIALAPEVLRTHARSRLMAYMVPTVWTELVALPRNANGKLDAAALLSLPADSADAFVSPRRALPVESGPANLDVMAPAAQVALAAIWSRLLGHSVIVAEDNFFDIGGDSILAIQVVALAAQAGWRLTVKDIFEHQTLAALALATKSCLGVTSESKDSRLGVTSEADALNSADGEPHEIAGDVLPLPIHAWFFKTVQHAPSHWNQGLLLIPSAQIDADALELTLNFLQRHHDMLRLRIAAAADGGWRMRIAPTDATVSLQRINLSADAANDFAVALHERAQALQAGFAFDGNPLFRAVWFTHPEGERRLWLLAHHALVDAVSWRILMADFDTLLHCQRAGEPLRLQAKTLSFPAWAARVQTLAHSPEVRAGRSFWRRRLAGPWAEPPSDIVNGGADREADTETATLRLGAEESDRLLRRGRNASGSGVDAVLATAVAIAFENWTGARRLVLALEGHGRDLLDSGDVSRTVGWFTLNRTLALELPEARDPARRLATVQAQLAALPQGGAGYGLLRYLNPSPWLEALPQAPIALNYLGRIGVATLAGDNANSEPLLRMAKEDTGSPRAPEGKRPHLIDLLGYADDSGFVLQFRYSRGRFHGATIARFVDACAAALRALIALPPLLHTPLPARAAAASLLMLREADDATPLFCVHPAGGSVACYRPLTEALAKRAPHRAVYGLQAPALGGDAHSLGDFATMAAWHIAALRQRQPCGPYHLLGWSQGGVLAYEIGRQLIEAGEQLAFLALIDSAYCPQRLRPDDGDPVARLIEYLREQAPDFVPDFAPDLARDLAPDSAVLQADAPRETLNARDANGAAIADARFTAVVVQAQTAGLLAAGLDAGTLLPLLQMQQEIVAAARDYRPSPMLDAPDAVWLLRAANADLFGDLGTALGWPDEIAAGWRQTGIPGDHFDCVRGSQASVLAQVLLTALSELEANAEVGEDD